MKIARQRQGKKRRKARFKVPFFAAMLLVTRGRI
jgi:hypothetical protein